MISILFRILLGVLIVWLLRYFLTALKGPSKATGSKNNSADLANHMVKDPECGMYMDSRLAIHFESAKESFYFCSEECKKKYIKRSPGEGMGSASAR